MSRVPRCRAKTIRSQVTARYPAQLVSPSSLLNKRMSVRRGCDIAKLVTLLRVIVKLSLFDHGWQLKFEQPLLASVCCPVSLGAKVCLLNCTLT
jgi:hypothetical protein